MAKVFPYIASSQTGIAPLHPDRVRGIAIKLISEVEEVPFFDMVARSNRLSFTGTTKIEDGSLSLPGWVLLDCYLMPSAVVGFTVRAADLPPDLYQAMQPPSTDAHVPITGYTAIPSADPRTWIGVSLYSLLTGQRLGLRTKAMALAVYGTERQIGVTQLDNASLRIHTMFGPLRLLQMGPPTHTLAHKTVIYELAVPQLPFLQKAMTEMSVTAPPEPQPAGEWLEANDTVRMAELKLAVTAEPGRWAVVYPGARPGPRGQQVCVAKI